MNTSSVNFHINLMCFYIYFDVTDRRQQNLCQVLSDQSVTLLASVSIELGFADGSCSNIIRWVMERLRNYVL